MARSNWQIRASLYFFESDHGSGYGIAIDHDVISRWAITLKMAAEVETQIVPEPQQEVDRASRDTPQDHEGKKSGSRLFRRKKSKQGNEKKSRKPPGKRHSMPWRHRGLEN